MTSQTKDNFGLVARFLGFVIDVTALAALINAKVAPRIPFIDYPLGVTAKLTLWMIALVSYLGLLRYWWLPTTKKVFVKPADSFGEFVVMDVLLGFRYWYMLIPFIVLAGFLVSIFIEMGAVFLTIACLIGLVTIIAGFYWFDAEREASEKETINKIEVYNLWSQRIEKELSDYGYVTNYDLSRLYNESQSLCSKALTKYFNSVESDMNHVLVRESIFIKSKNSSTFALVLARRTLINSKPWIRDPRR